MGRQDMEAQTYYQGLKAYYLRILCREKARDFGYEALLSSIVGNPSRKRHAFDTMSILNVIAERLERVEVKSLANL